MIKPNGENKFLTDDLRQAAAEMAHIKIGLCPAMDNDRLITMIINYDP